MRLNPSPFEAMKAGKKTIEIRLNDQKRRLVNAGDTIVFTQTDTAEQLTAEVLARHEFPCFRELYERLSPDACGIDTGIEECLALTYASYYTKEQETKHGVLGIEISVNKPLSGQKVMLANCEKALWHEFYKNYVSDPMMESTIYAYNFERVEKDYHSKTSDPSRLYFLISQGSHPSKGLIPFILNKGKAIGQIYLKHIDHQKRTAELGIALSNDSVKGKGYGSEAARLLINYAFNTLGFEKLTADTVLQNIRSQHVLKNLGFEESGEDSKFKYYQLIKEKNNGD